MEKVVSSVVVKEGKLQSVEQTLYVFGKQTHTQPPRAGVFLDLIGAWVMLGHINAID